MNKTRPSAEQLSAYIDGELDADTAVFVADAAARDADLARQLADLTKLKATLPLTMPAMPDIEIPSKARRRAGWSRASRKIGLGFAAALTVAAVLGAGGWLGAPVEAPLQQVAASRIGLAEAHHRGWTPRAGEGVDNLMVQVGASGLGYMAPDLSAAKLTLAVAEAIDLNGAAATHFGYIGTRGCKVSLFVSRNAFEDLAISPQGDMRQAGWTVRELSFLMMASGMDPARFDEIVEATREFTRFQLPFDDRTRQQLAAARALSAPCMA